MRQFTNEAASQRNSSFPEVQVDTELKSRQLPTSPSCTPSSSLRHTSLLSSKEKGKLWVLVEEDLSGIRPGPGRGLRVSLVWRGRVGLVEGGREPGPALFSIVSAQEGLTDTGTITE